jgi:hypothetical protein
MSDSQAQNRTLKDFQWKNRLLIIYTEDEISSQLENQLSEITQNKERYKDRHLKVIFLKDQKFNILGSDKPNQLEYTELIKELNIDEGQGYRNFLIGKDGGVKLREVGRISTEKLFDTIDAMPMRQREMRDGI